jgi:hypothetical protein
MPDGSFIVITLHVDDVSADRRGIAVSDSDLELLASGFTEKALYKDNKPGGALTYFVDHTKSHS